MIVYNQKKTTEKELLLHLQKCDDLFFPKLSSTVDLYQYTLKILANAITFEAWNSEELVGVIAAYFNDADSQIGFITNVSVIKEYSNQGIAGRLLTMAQVYATKNEFHRIRLEVDRQNSKALAFYFKRQFKIIKENRGSILMEYYNNNVAQHE